MFTCVCKLNYTLTNSWEDFSKSHSPKINYSDKNGAECLQIIPNGLLNETDVKSLQVAPSNIEEMPVIFSNSQTEFSFDVFSAVFFMISRYEEYLPFQTDNHGRFPITENTAYKLGFHKKAMVHHWTNFLLQKIKKKSPQIDWKENTTKMHVSIDIDNAYAIINKNFFRTLKSLFSKDSGAKWNTLRGKQKDPYDTYDYMDAINRKYHSKSIYFILCSDSGKYDRNISPYSLAFDQLVRRCKKNGEVGIHPSYSSNQKPELLKKELDIMEKRTGHKIQKSRQHFLKLRFPDTYSNLIKEGITNDYSMGFAEESGFRSGIAVPYPYYDLKEELEKELTIHPFQFMESTYIYYKNKDEALTFAFEQLKNIIDEVKSVNGTFIPIWHNESLGNWSIFKGWKNVFEMMYEYWNKE